MVSNPAEDKALEEYLRRKSALSMGYRKLYIEAPPPELDRAITARARRALRWIVPAIISACIAVGLTISINLGIHKFMRATVSAEQSLIKTRQEQKEAAERERLEQPISVVIDAKNIAAERAKEETARANAINRAEWLAKIERLKARGKQAEAAAELQRFQAVYPDSVEK